MKPRYPMRLILCAITLLMPLAASAHEYKAGALLIDHPKIVETPPGAKVAAGYVTLKNSGPDADRLLAIESNLKVELHSSTIVDGIARMKQMEEGLEVPAGTTVGLGEDGTHAMFMGLDRQLKTGDTLDAVLIFEKAGRVGVVFNVEKRSRKTNESHENH